jgi:three-Cys-motif partner protein
MARKNDEVGPWTATKLDALRKYLEAYTKILRKQDHIKGYYYVDGFAGLGRWRLKGLDEFIDGSPRVALGIQHPFTAYYFIELDPQRAELLREMRQEFPRHRIQVLEGDANRILVEDIAPQITYGQYRRGVAFLDPYAMNLDFATVEALAAADAIEVFINVPIMALNRDTLPNFAAHLTESDIARGARFWGDPNWTDEFYEVVGKDLWGENWIVKIQSTTAERISEVYRQRLLTIFPYVSEVAIICNATKQPIYSLVFAGPNETGKDIANNVLGKIGTPLSTLL